MRREEIGRAVEGGFVREYAVDLLEKSINVVVEVLDDGVMSEFELTFGGVRLLRLEDDYQNRWERIEITELRLDQVPEHSPAEEWAVWINMWDTAQLWINCASVRVDGELLT